MANKSDILLEEDRVTLKNGGGAPVVDIEGGNNWNLEDGSQGDLRIGDESNNLRVGVALGGAGEGIARLWATSLLRLGLEKHDSIVEVDEGGLKVKEGDIRATSPLRIGLEKHDSVFEINEYGIKIEESDIDINRDGESTISIDSSDESIELGKKSDTVGDWRPIYLGSNIFEDDLMSAGLLGGEHVPNIESSDVGLRLGTTEESGALLIFSEAEERGYSVIRDDIAVHGSVLIDGQHGRVEAKEFKEDSDARCKEDIETIDGALESLRRLRGVSFVWNDERCPGINEAERDLGLVAQEVKEVLPEAVSQREDGKYQLSYSSVIPVLVEALKEQQEAIDRQEETIEQMEQRIQRLEESVGTNSDNSPQENAAPAAA